MKKQGITIKRNLLTCRFQVNADKKLGTWIESKAKAKGWSTSFFIREELKRCMEEDAQQENK